MCDDTYGDVPTFIVIHQMHSTADTVYSYQCTCIIKRAGSATVSVGQYDYGSCSWINLTASCSSSSSAVIAVCTRQQVR
jgi:hypothetical protein